MEAHVFEHVYDDSAGSDGDTEETLSSTDTWSTEEGDEEEETAKNEMIDFIVPDDDDEQVRKLVSDA